MILTSSIPVLGSLLSPIYFQFFLDKVNIKRWYAWAICCHQSQFVFWSYTFILLHLGSLFLVYFLYATYSWKLMPLEQSKIINYIMICSICIILLLLFICEWFLHLASVILQVLDAFCSSLEINKIRNFAQFNIILSFGGSYFFYKYISQLCFFLISVQLASSLGPRFYANIFKCKHISETGAQQVVMICKLHLCSFQIKHVSIREAALMHDITIILKGILIYI